MIPLAYGEVLAFAAWAREAYVPRKTYVMDPYAYRMLRWHSENPERRHPSRRERRDIRTAAALDRRALRTYRVAEAAF